MIKLFKKKGGGGDMTQTGWDKGLGKSFFFVHKYDVWSTLELSTDIETRK